MQCAGVRIVLSPRCRCEETPAENLIELIRTHSRKTMLISFGHWWKSVLVGQIEQDAELSHRGQRDAAVHFDTYRTLLRHRAVSLPLHAFLVGLCLQTAELLWCPTPTKRRTTVPISYVRTLLPELYALPPSKLLQVPRTNIQFGSRSCHVRTPLLTLWNSLPHSVRFCESLTTFRKHLKTFYFQRHFLNLTHPSHPHIYPRASDSIINNFGCFINSYIHLITCLLTSVKRSKMTGYTESVSAVQNWSKKDSISLSSTHTAREFGSEMKRT